MNKMNNAFQPSEWMDILGIILEVKKRSQLSLEEELGFGFLPL